MTIRRSTRITLSVATVAAVSVSLLVGLSPAALGQLEPDDTLGGERSQVREVSPVDFDVEGGARRGNNLFHSFREFNVNEGGSVYFANPNGVENILSRVTGVNPSNILGVLGVFGDANLFLINPNGILFGPNASLDVRGSFAATTADGIQFGEQGFFSATSPETPGILTVNPSAFFFNQIPTGNITVQSTIPIFPELGINGLFVPVGENLILLGGNVNLEGGRLNALGGRIDIGAVNSTGTVSLSNDGSLSFSADIQRGEVLFTDAARADVRTLGSGGDIAITAREFTLTNGSALLAGIFPGEGTSQSQAGNIRLNATGRVLITQSSDVGNLVFADATGNAGNIEIVTPILEVLNGAQLNASTRGQGNAGSVTVSASDRVTFRGTSTDGLFNSAAFSRINATGNGIGGNVEITTAILEVLDGAQLNAGTLGQGSAGSVIISASDRVTFRGTSTDGQFSSAALSTTGQTGNGSGGNIVITTPILQVLEGGQLQASTSGQGNAGNVIISASDRVTFRGTSASGLNSAAFSRVNATGNGTGGNVEVTAPILEVLDGAQLTSTTFGQGNAGNVIILSSDRVTFRGTSPDGQYNSAAYSRVEETGNGTGGNIEITTAILEVLDGGELSAETRGQGNAGSVIISASGRVTFRGTGAIAFSTVEETGYGTGGNVEIVTPILEVLDGAQLAASTRGQGNAGNVIISASDRVTFRGTSPDGQFSSAAFSTVEQTGNGTGGNIEITTPILQVLDGGQLLASTSGQGNAGSVIISASGRVTFGRTSANGLSGAAFSRVNATGNGTGGNVEITAPILEVLDGAQLNAGTLGQGSAGNVIISASDRVTFDGGFVFSAVDATGNGAGGNIEITAPVLEVLNGSQLAANTNGQGSAGNVIISASDRVLLDGVGSGGFSSGVFTSAGVNATGRGGRITVTTPGLHIANGAMISALTANNRSGGNVVIEADQFTALNGGQVITSALSSGRAGTITVNADRILLSGADATYDDRLERFGRAVVANQGNRSGLFANTRSSSTGSGGRITVNSNALTLENGARISAQSQGTGTAGDIRLNVFEQLQLTDSDILTTAPRSSGGDIEVNAGSNSGITILRGDSDITTNSQGNGGNITLQGSGIIAFDDSDILARSQDARGGNITLAPSFGANTALESEPPFDGNDRVDVNADGSVAAGTITTPDTSFIQNSLTELPDAAIDTENLVANSCVVRSQEQGGTFTITGSEGLPQRPGDTPLPTYPTGEVRSIPTEALDEPQSWQMGDPIVEPQGAYPLEDGRIVLSRECDNG